MCPLISSANKTQRSGFHGVEPRLLGSGCTGRASEGGSAVGSGNLRSFVPVGCWRSSRIGAEPSLKHNDFSTAKYQSRTDKGGG